MAVKVKKGHFSAGSKIYAAVHDGLTEIIRGLAVDNARLAIAVSAVTDFVDNSTGVADTKIVDVPALDSIDASASAVGSPAAGLNASLVELDNAFAVIAENVNKARTRLGLTALTYAGTVAISGTIPDAGKAGTSTQGNATAAIASTRAAFVKAEQNVSSLTYAVNEVLTAIGVTAIPNFLKGSYPASKTIASVGQVTASATGADATFDLTVDAALVVLANNITTLAAIWNANMAQTAQATTPLNVIAG